MGRVDLFIFSYEIVGFITGAGGAGGGAIFICGSYFSTFMDSIGWSGHD